MRRATFVISALALALALGTAARADEIIRFKNGTYLTIKSHVVAEGMVTVVLGSDARMSFPVSLVEAIERGGVSLFRPVIAPNVVGGKHGGSSTPGAVSLNDMPNRPDYRVYASVPPRPTGRTSKSARRAAMMATDPVDLLFVSGESGAPVSASVFPGHEDPNHRNFTVTGNSSLVEGVSYEDEDGTVTIPPPEEMRPRGRASSVQQRMVPLPTHPSEREAIRTAEGDSAQQKTP